MSQVRLCKRCGGPLKDARNPWHNRLLCLDCEIEERRKRKVLIAKAHYWVQQAVKKGIIPKLDGSVKCVDCGYWATVYDHRDYRKPRVVEPVCHSCNWNRGPALPMADKCRLARRTRISFQRKRKIGKFVMR